MPYSTLGFSKQVTGSNANAWGDELNEAVIDLIDEALRGMVSLSLSGTTYTLTATNGVSNEARCMFLNVTGGTGGTIGVPTISKWYFVRNASTGDVVITTGAATTATIPSGAVLPVVCDGSSVWTLRIDSLQLKEYIDSAVLAATGTLPATTGNEGKALVVESGAWVPKQLTSDDIADYNAKAIAFAVSL